MKKQTIYLLWQAVILPQILICSCSFSIPLQPSLMKRKQMWYQLLLSQDEKYTFIVWNPWDLGVDTLPSISLCWLIHYIMKTS